MDAAGAELMDQALEMAECITVRVPRGTSLALERAAIGAHARPGQLARRMLLDGLRASGFELAPTAEIGGNDVSFLITLVGQYMRKSCVINDLRAWISDKIS